MTSYIGITNKITGATITVTGEVTGFEKENAYDWNTFDFWKSPSSGLVYFTIDFGSVKTVDGWAIGFSNIAGSSSSIVVQYSNDNFASNTVDFSPSEIFVNNNLIVRKTTSVSTRYMRFKINSIGKQATIGFLWIGELIKLQRGFSTGFVSPILARDKKIMNTKSEGGQPLGTSVIQEGYKFNINQVNVTSAWIDSNWSAIADHLESPNRFLFLWDEENRPNESIFAWVDGAINYPRYNNPNHLDFNIPCKGLII